MNISMIFRSVLALCIVIGLAVSPLSAMKLEGNEGVASKIKSFVRSGIKRCTSIFQQRQKNQERVRRHNELDQRARQVQARVDLGVQIQLENVKPAVEIVFGECSECGKRSSNEDAHMHYYDEYNNVRMFGVFDGHSGKGCSEYMVKDNRMALSIINDENFSKGNIEEALRNGFLSIDQEFCNLCKQDNCSNGLMSLQPGSTANVVLIDGKNDLYVANAGDSRVVIARRAMVNGRLVCVAERLSYDHKASDIGEINRITKLGGLVIQCRVYGLLAVARSIGDVAFKPYVTAEPYISKTSLDQDCSFLISGCDGIWDVMTDQDAVNIVNEAMIKMNVTSETITRAQAQRITQDLVGMAIADERQQDNVTAQVIFFK